MKEQFHIDYGSAIRVINRNASEYNKELPTREQIKGTRKNVFIQLVRMAGIRLKEIQNTEINPPLMVYTNSKVLASLVGCTDRTVRNAISFLVDKELIKKTFRGSKADYLVEVNLDWIILGSVTPVQLEEKRLENLIEEEEKKESNAIVSLTKRKNFPHSDTHKDKKLNEGNSLKERPQMWAESLDSQETPKAGKGAGGGQVTASGPRSRRRRQREESTELDFEGNEFGLWWRFVLHMLYRKSRLNKYQIEEGKRLAFGFWKVAIEDNGYLAGHEMLHRRITLAAQWIAKSFNHFVPLPVKYFDPTFDFGFKGTLRWYRKDLYYRKKLFAQVEIEKAVRIIYRNRGLGPEFREKEEELKRKLCVALSKLDENAPVIFRSWVAQDEMNAQQEIYAPINTKKPKRKWQK